MNKICIILCCLVSSVVVLTSCETPDYKTSDSNGGRKNVVSNGNYSAPVTGLKIVLYDNADTIPNVVVGNPVASKAMMLGLIPQWKENSANPSDPNYLNNPIISFSFSRLNEDGTETNIEDCFEYYSNDLYVAQMPQLYFDTIEISHLVNHSCVDRLFEPDAGFYLVAVHKLEKLQGTYRLKASITMADGEIISQISDPVNIIL